jgi:hypothetical protein
MPPAPQKKSIATVAVAVLDFCRFVCRIQYSLCAPLRSGDDLVIPKTEHLPAPFAKRPIYRLVPRDVAFDLRYPELAVRLNGLRRLLPVAAVPKRRIAEHRDLGAYYNEIRPPRHPAVLFPVPEPGGPHGAPEQQLY